MTIWIAIMMTLTRIQQAEHELAIAAHFREVLAAKGAHTKQVLVVDAQLRRHVRIEAR